MVRTWVPAARSAPSISISLRVIGIAVLLMLTPLIFRPISVDASQTYNSMAASVGQVIDAELDELELSVTKASIKTLKRSDLSAMLTQPHYGYQALDSIRMHLGGRADAAPSINIYYNGGSELFSYEENIRSFVNTRLPEDRKSFEATTTDYLHHAYVDAFVGKSAYDAYIAGNGEPILIKVDDALSAGSEREALIAYITGVPVFDEHSKNAIQINFRAAHLADLLKSTTIPRGARLIVLSPQGIIFSLDEDHGIADISEADQATITLADGGWASGANRISLEAGQQGVFVHVGEKGLSYVLLIPALGFGSIPLIAYITIFLCLLAILIWSVRQQWGFPFRKRHASDKALTEEPIGTAAIYEASFADPIQATPFEDPIHRTGMREAPAAPPPVFHRTPQLEAPHAIPDTDELETETVEAPHIINAERLELIDRVIAYINEHYMEDIGLKTVAAQVYMSPAYLGKIFKEVSENTFTGYLIAVRMEAAARLLRQGGLPIKDIAAKVGYHSTQSFCRLFKERYGCPPSDMRRQKAMEDLDT